MIRNESVKALLCFHECDKGILKPGQLSLISLLRPHSPPLAVVYRIDGADSCLMYVDSGFGGGGDGGAWSFSDISMNPDL